MLFSWGERTKFAVSYERNQEQAADRSIRGRLRYGGSGGNGGRHGCPPIRHIAKNGDGLVGARSRRIRTVEHETAEASSSGESLRVFEKRKQRNSGVEQRSKSRRSDKVLDGVGSAKQTGQSDHRNVTSGIIADGVIIVKHPRRSGDGRLNRELSVNWSNRPKREQRQPCDAVSKVHSREGAS